MSGMSSMTTRKREGSAACARSPHIAGRVGRPGTCGSSARVARHTGAPADQGATQAMVGRLDALEGVRLPALDARLDAAATAPVSQVRCCMQVDATR